MDGKIENNFWKKNSLRLYSEPFNLGLSNILNYGQEFDTLIYNPETNSLEIVKDYRLYPFVCTHKREKKLGMNMILEI